MARFKILFELFHPGSAEKDTIGVAVMQQPAKGDIEQGTACALRRLLQLLHGLKVLRVPITGTVPLYRHGCWC